ncbi:hypothetical protein VP1G_03647 [Cytospora mali]|uniref:Uncharacterized protein n=1 Tax=Cytospora mali TaxID=578113 RepID=A0A194UX66_CYTMA|nr:hypothetical protein VP1G_03647 [Valsa mali var. pyri (nom. inval.)]
MGVLKVKSAPNGQQTPTLFSIKPSAPVSSAYMQKFSSFPIPPLFWGAEHEAGKSKTFPQAVGNIEASELIGDGSLDACNKLVDDALDAIAQLFNSIDKPDPTSQLRVVDLRMSPELARWKEERQKQGRILPAKGKGLTRTTDKVIELMDISQWPEPVLTNNTLFGVGFMNFLIGAYDPHVMYSNYCVDVAFYYEHGYDRVFPQFEPVFKGSLDDPVARKTFAGAERRDAAKIGLRYIRSKIALEKKYLPFLSGRTAKFDRKTAMCIMFGESSLVGLAEETVLRGYDPAAVMADMVFSSPATDALDVGSDFWNSETMNSFMNTADITNTGIVSEEALRDVYDAYSFTCARMLTERWATPTAILNAQLYPWHIYNGRHMFLRRCLLGYEKVQRTKPELREGDMDEVFDKNYHTTGFSRPLQNGCNGHETCDQATEIIEGHERRELLAKLWWCLITRPIEYVKAGVVNPETESEIGRALYETMAECWHDGLVHELSWMLTHAFFHAWQVNFLMEAAMWGGFLDDGSLAGKLDRAT